MKLVTKYRCRDQSVFRRYWHCLFRKCCGQLKPVLFKLLQDLFCFLKLCQSLFQPIFRRAGICWHNFKEFLTSSSSLVHLLRSSLHLTTSPAWPALSKSIPWLNSQRFLTSVLHSFALFQPAENIHFYSVLCHCINVCKCPCTAQFPVLRRHCAGEEVRSPVLDVYKKSNLEIITVLI